MDVGLTEPKLLAGGMVRVRLAVASVLTLGLGALLAPPAPSTAQTTLTPPQEYSAPLLEEQVQLRTTARPFRGVVEAASTLTAYGTAILPAAAAPVSADFAIDGTSSPRGFGVRVSADEVLTHASGLDGRSVVRLRDASGIEYDGALAAFDPDSGLVLLQTVPSDGALPQITSAVLSPGALGVAAARWGQRDTVVPAFITSSGDGGYTIGSVGGPLAPGMPLFDLDGNLVAVAAGDSTGQAFGVADVMTRLRASTSVLPRASIGVEYQLPPDGLGERFGDHGVVVTHVVDGGPANLSGVAAGDVLLGVGEVEIDSLDSLNRALVAAVAGAPIGLTVSRNGRSRNVQVTPMAAFAVDALARRAGGGPAGVDAWALFPEERLAAAGIPPSARILSVNGRLVTTRLAVTRELRRATRPLALLVQEGARRFFVAIEPAR